MKLLDRIFGRKAAQLTYDQVADLIDGFEINMQVKENFGICKIMEKIPLLSKEEEVKRICIWDE